MKNPLFSKNVNASLAKKLLLGVVSLISLIGASLLFSARIHPPSVITKTESPIMTTPATVKRTPKASGSGNAQPGNQSIGNKNIVTICSSIHFCLGGKSYYPFGASFYSSTPAAGIISNPGGAIALAISQRLNTIRTNNWLSHSATVAAATTNSKWLPLDAFIGDAQSAGLKTFLDLSDFKSVLMKNCINPYTSYTLWDNYIAYAAHRVNSVTGSKYSTDPEIAFVQFAGEPREAGYKLNGIWHDGKYYTYAGAGTFNGDGNNPTAEPNWGTAAAGAGSCMAPLYYTTEDLNRFYAHILADWKSTGATVLALAGGLSKLDEPHNGGIDYQTIFADSNNDICGFKTYGGMEAWLSTGVQYCTNTLYKPSVNVEWGYTQGAGDASMAANFQRQFDNNNAAGIAGNFYWNAGFEKAATTYDVDYGSDAPLTFGTIVKNAH